MKIIEKNKITKSTAIIATFFLFFSVFPLSFSAQGQVESGGVMGNERATEVTWDEDLKKVTIIKGDDTIELFLDSVTVILNGEEQEIDVPAQLFSNRTFVPIRFVSEMLGESVEYDEETGDIDIGLEE